MSEKPSAVCLLSGGLDSATAMVWAIHQGYDIHALTISYGQIHSYEIECARRIASSYGAKEHKILNLGQLPEVLYSALTGVGEVPQRPWDPHSTEIPPTYVPCRNILFLSIAAGWAESIGAEVVVSGVNAIDYSGYPDCRPEFVQAFQKVLEVGTKRGVEGKPVRILTPLISLTKAQIVTLGRRLGVNFELTSSCYHPDPDGRPCGRCDSCQIRQMAFQEVSG